MSDHPAHARIAKANEVQSMRILSVTEQIEALGRCIAELACLVCGDPRPENDRPDCGTNHCTDRRACVQNCPWCRSDANLRGAW